MTSLLTSDMDYECDDGISNRYNLHGSDRNVKLWYSKSKFADTSLTDKVYLHPTPSVKDNIPGYIALLQRNVQETSSESINSASKNSDSFLLAWVPESCLSENLNEYIQAEFAENESPSKSFFVSLPPVTVQPNLSGQNGFAIPLSSIYSITSRLPSPAWWFGSLIINSRSGYPYPALFFHDSECESTILQKKKIVRESFDLLGASGAMFWGGDQVLTWLSRYVEVQMCEGDRNIHLIEPSTEDQEAFSINSVTVSYSNPTRDKVVSSASRYRENRKRSPRPTPMDPLTKFVRETGWNLMEKLSQVTNLARRTADSVIENPNLPPQVRRLLRNPEIQTLQEEFDSARIYLARWAMSIAEQSERERNQKSLIARKVLEVESTNVGDFELLDAELGSLNVSNKRKTITLVDWNNFFDQKNGVLVYTVDEVKERIFHGGLDAEDGVRKEAWLFLLGIHKWDSTIKERQQEVSRLRDEYVRLKGAWWNSSLDHKGENKEAELWREQKSRIEKDVHRTDRTVSLFAGEDIPHPDPTSPFAEVGTNVHLEQLKDMLLTYNEFNRELGYVQGMSDLLSPIYAVIQDDAIAFWAFKNFMHRMERNFVRDQSGMRKQLLSLESLVQLMDPKLYLHLQAAESTNFFFFFRMLLVWFKREFEWESILRLWESLWTDYLSSNFHLFIALAILEKHRDVIMDHLKHFDEVLKYVNELSATIDLESTLIRAEALFLHFQRMIEVIDKKSNFPAPRLHKRIKATQKSNETIITPSYTSGSDATGTSSHGYHSGKEITENTSVDGSKSRDDLLNTGQFPEVIAPELRQLLSREVETFSKE
ncbi:GTPase-activating protein GYP7 [Golovinomyces cichoracearum]|uniref:GTPase-activating protein GYP7 n=1 Tax=Golovinomyces cichoracearum TaxID=62708 RepID=A0A420IYL3_9PEZI|nr:GTPase-activating protein GYP7 [Golovinomyces cichoracearum]